MKPNPRKAIKSNIWEVEDDPNWEIIDEFINTFQSLHSKNGVQKKLRWIFSHLYQIKEKGFILEYSAENFRTIFLLIDKMQIRQSSKMRYFTALKQLVQFAEDPYRAKGKRYSDTDFDYIFSNRFLRKKFRDSGYKMQKNHIEAKKLMQFLDEVKAQNPFDYVLFKFFLSSCRPVALSSLLVKNIDFKHFCFFPDKDKSTSAKSGKDNTYFFAEEFASEIRWYIEAKDLGPEDYIFPIHGKTMLKRLKSYQTNWTNYDFRRSIKWLWKSAGMDIVDRMTLSNQATPDEDEPKEVTIDKIYSEETELDKLHRIFECFWQKIFRNG